MELLDVIEKAGMLPPKVGDDPHFYWEPEEEEEE